MQQAQRPFSSLYPDHVHLCNGWLLSKQRYQIAYWLGLVFMAVEEPGVGVTNPIFSVPLFSTFSIIVKTNANYWISRLYLAGNMNVIQGI